MISPPPSPMQDISDQAYHTDELPDEVGFDGPEEPEGFEEPVDTHTLTLGDIAWHSLLPCEELHDAFANRSTVTLEFCPTLLEWFPDFKPPVIINPTYRLSTYNDEETCGAMMEHIIGEEPHTIALMELSKAHLGDAVAEESWRQENTDGGVLGFRALLQSLIWGGKCVKLERFEDAGRWRWKAVCNSVTGQDPEIVLL